MVFVAADGLRSRLRLGGEPLSSQLPTACGLAGSEKERKEILEFNDHVESDIFVRVVLSEYYIYDIPKSSLGRIHQLMSRGTVDQLIGSSIDP